MYISYKLLHLTVMNTKFHLFSELR